MEPTNSASEHPYDINGVNRICDIPLSQVSSHSSLNDSFFDLSPPAIDGNRPTESHPRTLVDLPLESAVYQGHKNSVVRRLGSLGSLNSINDDVIQDLTIERPADTYSRPHLAKHVKPTKKTSAYFSRNVAPSMTDEQNILPQSRNIHSRIGQDMFISAWEGQDREFSVNRHRSQSAQRTALSETGPHELRSAEAASERQRPIRRSKNLRLLLAVADYTRDVKRKYKESTTRLKAKHEKEILPTKGFAGPYIPRVAATQFVLTTTPLTTQERRERLQRYVQGGTAVGDMFGEHRIA